MTLINLRQQIDEIDTELVALLGKRQVISDEIGKVKKMNDLPVTDELREEHALQLRSELAEKHGLTAEEADRFFRAIFAISKKRQA